MNVKWDPAHNRKFPRLDKGIVIPSDLPSYAKIKMISTVIPAPFGAVTEKNPVGKQYGARSFHPLWQLQDQEHLPQP